MLVGVKFRLQLLAGVVSLLAATVCRCDDDPWYDEFVPLESRRHTDMYISEANDFRVYHGACFHNGKIFGIVPSGEQANITAAISANQRMVELPAISGKDFYDNLDAVWLPGNTLAIDFAFPAFADNMGHWAEASLPAFSVFQSDAWHKHVVGAGAANKYIDTVFLVNLKADQLSNWFLEVLRIVLAPVTGPDGPQVIDTQDLAELDKVKWLVIENYITVTDRYSHATGYEALQKQQQQLAVEGAASCVGNDGVCENRLAEDPWTYGFLEPEHASKFRAASYDRVGIPPSDPSAVPKTITFVTSAAGEVVVNKYEVMAMLWQVAATYGWKVRPLTITNAAPFASHVTAMSETGILMARHGPSIADAVFLPAGAAVYELLPYNWEWRQISELYRNITRSGGELHHYAWRANAAKWANYPTLDDERYSTWTAAECVSRSCMMTHAKAGLRVDIETVREDVTELIRSMEAAPAAGACSTVQCKVSGLDRDWPAFA